MPSFNRLLADPEAGLARLQEIVDAGETVRFDQFDCADGRRIGFDHVPLDAGRLWGFRDITQFKLQDEEQAEFLATMSHEIKTPLSGIAGAAELLINAKLPERERELAEVIADAAQALGGLVRDTLDVTRAESGRTESESEDYDPRRLLTSIAGVLRPSLRGRPLELLVDVDAEVPDALHGDAARVRQIVLNLASNAVKYTETGHARIAARAENERLLHHRLRHRPRHRRRGSEPPVRAVDAQPHPGLGGHRPRAQHRPPARPRDGRRRDRRLRARHRHRLHARAAADRG